MQPLIQTHAGARVTLHVLLGILIVGELVIRLRGLRGGAERADRGTLFVIAASVGAGVGVGFALAYDAPGLAITGVRWELYALGVALIVAGLGLRYWSVWLLGASFTVDLRVREGQEVVDRGPYRLLRHPSYTGLIMVMIGLGCALGSAGSLAALALLPTAGLIVRIGVEERMLRERLGEPYVRFASTRARLIPHVW